MSDTPTVHIGLRIKCLSNSIKRGLNYLAMTSLPDEFKNMTGTQGMFIEYILSKEPRSVFQKDIESEFNIRRPTATKILQLMEQNGLLIRESVPTDARLKKLTPTDKGRLFNQLLHKNLLNIDNQIKKDISREDLDTFVRVLDQMIKNTQELDEGKP
jgi:DNA-binding MarR family transcriptional regulator